MTRSRIDSSLAVVAASVLSAACATTRYTQSRIETLPTEAKGRAGESVSLELEGLKVRVESLDRATRDKEIPNLGLRLVFEPREVGYSFDPGQVVLRGADGREWRAAGGESRPLYAKTCLDLAFDTTVPLGQPMDVVLGGLAHGTKRIDPVTVRLVRHEGRSYGRLYWLEAVGYAVVIPIRVITYLACPYCDG